MPQTMRRKSLIKLKEQNGLCFYCFIKIDLKAKEGTSKFLTGDHRIPKSRGGSNSIRNIVAACAGCNHRKAEMTDKEYILFLGGLFIPDLLFKKMRIANKANKPIIFIDGMRVNRHVTSFEINSVRCALERVTEL